MEPLPGLGRRAERRHGEVGLIGRGAVKALMWTLGIVEIQITADGAAGFANAVIGPQIHLLVFDASPQTGLGSLLGALSVIKRCSRPKSLRQGPREPWGNHKVCEGLLCGDDRSTVFDAEVPQTTPRPA